MQKVMIVLLLIAALSAATFGQTVTQTVQGKVLDNMTQIPLAGAYIVLNDSDPIIGTTCDVNGQFLLEKVPVGRQSIKVMMMGYEDRLITELMIQSGKQTRLEVNLEQKMLETEEVVVSVNKEVPLNTMTTVSSRQFTVEETQRYAGGMDDPARLASSFAGVATPSLSSNGISVRGNNPQGMLWRIEGVEAPNPNHFADLTVTGGGLLTALSNHTMGNSDFFTGAFPAEYGNATSGVFDINLKTGNSQKREYTLQAGLLGVDFAAQGPVVTGKEASYLMNYRYSTMALVSPVLPNDTGILKYQDLAFKLNYPTKKTGTFTLWGVGASDGQEMDAADSVDWEANFDRDNSQTSLYMFATGLSHKKVLGPSLYIKTILSATGNGLSHKEQRLDFNLQAHPHSKVQNDTWRYSIQSGIGTYFSKKHSNQTGFSYSQLGYGIDIEKSRDDGELPTTTAKQQDQAGLLQVYSQSKATPLPGLSINIGLHALYFALNKNTSIEPRAGLKYSLNNTHSLAFAYGLHSRIEQLPVYFVKNNGNKPNKNLDLMKSSHYVLSYNLKLNDYLRLSVEPYYQHLTAIPVSPDSYISTINMQNDIFFDEKLVSEGSGRNIGIDVTLERFLHNGFYYLVTGSIFDSNYKAADNITRSTRFNKNYVINILAGKEWALGRDKNKILSANIRLNYMGGNRKEPINSYESFLEKDVVYGETNGAKAFSRKYSSAPIFSFTISYRNNRPGYSSIWALQVLNATGSQEYSNDFYNLKTGQIETKNEGIIIPNLSYKIEF